MPKSTKTKEIELQAAAESAAKRFGFTPQSVRSLSTRTFMIDALWEDGRECSLILKASKVEPSFQTWIEKPLYNAGFKLIPEYHYDDNPAAFIEQDGLYWTCQACTGGITYDWLSFNCPSQHCFLAGETLKALHKAGAKVVRMHKSIANAPHKIDVLKQFPARLEQTIAKISEYKITAAAKAKKSAAQRNEAIELLKGSNFSIVLGRSNLLIPHLVKLETLLDKTIVHGDFHPGNLIFTRNGVVGVVDWEYSGIGSAMYDLSYAMFIFCLQLSKEGQPDAEYFSSRRTEAFLDGYIGSDMRMINREGLSYFTEFFYLLHLEWACHELMKEHSSYAEHPNFLNFVKVMQTCTLGVPRGK